MIVRQQKFEMPKNFLFNLAGCSVIVLAGVLAIRSSVVKDEVPLCEARYGGGLLFSFASSSGEPFTPEDIQARLGGMDWGLTANARVVAETGVAKGHALEVALRGASPRDANSQTRSGMGFIWQPRQLAAAASACLSYSVWTPTDFKTGEGGALPGLSSDGENTADTDQPAAAAAPSADGTPPAADAPLKPFSVRAQWRKDGGFALQQAQNIGGKSVSQVDGPTLAFKPGQWTRIEQEAVLNTPGKSNGILRMWIDGKLTVERTNMGYRNSDLQSFQAVSVDTHYIKNGAWAAAPADTRMRLSPLELRLR